MLRGRCSRTISERPTLSPFASHSLSRLLTPLFPLDASHSPISPLFPLHTQKQGRVAGVIGLVTYKICRRGDNLVLARDTKFARPAERQGDGEIPRLRDPTRHTAARKRKSGRSARDDSENEGQEKGGWVPRSTDCAHIQRQEKGGHDVSCPYEREGDWASLRGDWW